MVELLVTIVGLLPDSESNKLMFLYLKPGTANVNLINIVYIKLHKLLEQVTYNQVWPLRINL